MPFVEDVVTAFFGALSSMGAAKRNKKDTEKEIEDFEDAHIDAQEEAFQKWLKPTKWYPDPVIIDAEDD